MTATAAEHISLKAQTGDSASLATEMLCDTLSSRCLPLSQLSCRLLRSWGWLEKEASPGLNGLNGNAKLLVDEKATSVAATAAGLRVVPKPLAPSSPPTRRVSSSETGLRRFTVPQKSTYARAMREISRGEKESCWMWFMIPTPPYVVDGLERGSARNRRFALRSDEEVREYLRFEADGVNLRDNYLGLMRAIVEQLQKGRKVVQLLGGIDEPKLRSSVKLFERAARDMDAELHGVLLQLLGLLDEEPE